MVIEQKLYKFSFFSATFSASYMRPVKAHIEWKEDSSVFNGTAESVESTSAVLPGVEYIILNSVIQQQQ